MFAFWMRRKSLSSETSWDKNVDNTVYGPRRKYSCCMVSCTGIVATIFFAVGLFQTVIAFAFVRESSRNPILILGPVFMGIGAVLCMGSVEMCINKFRKPKQMTMVGSDCEGQPYNSETYGDNLDKNTGVILRADLLGENEQKIQNCTIENNLDVPVSAGTTDENQTEETVPIADDGTITIPEEILQMLEQVQETYRNDTPISEENEKSEAPDTTNIAPAPEPEVSTAQPEVVLDKNDEKAPKTTAAE